MLVMHQVREFIENIVRCLLHKYITRDFFAKFDFIPCFSSVAQNSNKCYEKSTTVGDFQTFPPVSVVSSRAFILIISNRYF